MVDVETAMPLIILLAVIVAVLWHALLARVVWATLGSTLTSTFLIWLFTQSHFGWMDRMFIKNLLLAVIVALIAAVLVGNVFQRVRKARAAR